MSKEGLYPGAIDIPTASPVLVCGSQARILDIAEQSESPPSRVLSEQAGHLAVRTWNGRCSWWIVNS
jgi:hypothetical protein